MVGGHRGRRLSRGLGLLVAALLALSCNQLFYFPSRVPSELKLGGAHSVHFPSLDGTRLHGLWIPTAQRPARGTVVQFHGNAGNVTTHVRALEWLGRAGYDLFVFDYRGYGRSEGSPFPQGVVDDAVAALGFVQAALPRSGSGADLVLVGQSLGGAVMLAALGEAGLGPRVRQVVVESSFHSYSEVAASVAWRSGLLFPLVGVAYGLVSDEWSPAHAVGKLAPTPVLFVHGLDDEVVAPRFSAALFGLARAPRALLMVPRVGHQGPMAVCADRYRRAYLTIIEHRDPASCPVLEPGIDTFLCQPSLGVQGAPAPDRTP